MIDQRTNTTIDAARAARAQSLGLLDRPSDIVRQLERIEAKLNALYNLFALHEPPVTDTQVPVVEDPDF